MNTLRKASDLLLQMLAIIHHIRIGKASSPNPRFKMLLMKISLALCASVFIPPKESCLRHGMSCPLEVPLCLSVDSTWIVDDQTEMTKQEVGKIKSTLGSSGLASTKSPQELRGEP